MKHDPREPEPLIAAGLFGANIDKARAFAQDLFERGEPLGLIGPLEPPRLWSRHLVNSALVAPLLWENAKVGDVGSGAGFPGIVLAIARPDVNFALIEPMERRVDWLQHQVRALDLPNVEVVHARAQEAEFSPWLDQVTGRAVSALSKLIPMTARITRSGGQLILMKGANVQVEMDAAAKAIKKARLSDLEILILGDGQVSEVTRVFRATVD